jgi:hypothetical protein
VRKLRLYLKIHEERDIGDAPVYA